jgi:hypothetical protein
MENKNVQNQNLDTAAIVAETGTVAAEVIIPIAETTETAAPAEVTASVQVATETPEVSIPVEIPSEAIEPVQEELLDAEGIENLRQLGIVPLELKLKTEKLSDPEKESIQGMIDFMKRLIKASETKKPIDETEQSAAWVPEEKKADAATDGQPAVDGQPISDVLPAVAEQSVQAEPVKSDRPKNWRLISWGKSAADVHSAVA